MKEEEDCPQALNKRPLCHSSWFVQSFIARFFYESARASVKTDRKKEIGDSFPFSVLVPVSVKGRKGKESKKE